MAQKCTVDSSEASVRTTGKKTVNTSGGQVYYEQQGSGKHAILCIPGALATVKFFPSQLEHFGRADSPYTIVAFDPMGYGYSRPPERNYAIKPELYFERDAIDGHTLMKSLSLPKCSLFGWCNGANTAIFFAAMFPEAVNKLVIWGSKAYYTKEDVEMFENFTHWNKQLKGLLDNAYGAYFPKLWSRFVKTFRTIYTERGGDVCKEALSKVKCPTLIIHGAKDPLCQLSHSEYLHKNIAGSQLVIMPEGKHHLHMQLASEFNETVEEFLAQ